MSNHSNRRDMKSAAVVAQILSAEGFSEYLANEVKRYWMKQICNPRAIARARHKKTAFSELVKEKLNEGDRVILGKFISLVEKMAFDTGIRVGLAAFMYGARVADADIDAHVEVVKQWNEGKHK